MKKVILILGIGAFTFLSCEGSSETTDETNTDTTKTEVVEVEEESTGKVLLSPRMQAVGTVNGNEIIIDYGAPSVRERAVWGELVKYDKVWRAGANETTAITFNAPAKLNGNDIDAGTYALFITPKAKGNWTVILNEEWSVDEHDAWGSSHYDATKDVLVFDVAPEWAEDSEELLTYGVTETGITFAWEKARLNIAVE